MAAPGMCESADNGNITEMKFHLLVYSANSCDYGASGTAQVLQGMDIDSSVTVCVCVADVTEHVSHFTVDQLKGYYK